jgi:hypothetical protein
VQGKRKRGVGGKKEAETPSSPGNRRLKIKGVGISVRECYKKEKKK